MFHTPLFSFSEPWVLSAQAHLAKGGPTQAPRWLPLSGTLFPRFLAPVGQEVSSAWAQPSVVWHLRLEGSENRGSTGAQGGVSQQADSTPPGGCEASDTGLSSRGQGLLGIPFLPPFLPPSGNYLLNAYYVQDPCDTTHTAEDRTDTSCP